MDGNAGAIRCNKLINARWSCQFIQNVLEETKIRVNLKSGSSNANERIMIFIVSMYCIYVDYESESNEAYPAETKHRTEPK
jgi:hypothetical protein